MAAITGSGGKVNINGTNTMGEAMSWALNLSRDIVKNTPYGNTWQRKKAGMGDWTMKVTVNFDPADLLAQIALYNSLVNGATVTIAEFVNGSNNYSGTAAVKDFAIKVQPDGIVQVDLDLEGSGTPAYA